MSDMLNVHEAAEYLRVNEYTLRRLAREGVIPAFKVGRIWRFRKAALDQWAENQRKGMSNDLPRVLVIDDQEPARRFITDILEPEGFAVEVAESGARGLASLETRRPNLVFLDLLMPEMDGAEVLREIRTRFGDLPVVILTAYPDSEVMERTLPHSPVTLLAKPCTRDKILRCVRGLVHVSD